MDQKFCQTCMHFRQHYSLDSRKFIQVHCGHCVYPKVKTKKPYAKICDHYQQAEPRSNAFVTKEYLSKELLDYVLKLELLPLIKEIENV